MSASASFFPRLHSLYKEVDQTRRQPPAWTILNQMIEEMGREIKHIEQDHPCLSDGRRTIALIPEEQYVHHWKEDELHIDRKISCFYLLFQGRMGMGLDKNHCCQEGDLIFSYQGKEYRFPSDMSQRIQSFLNTNWTSSHRCAEFMASSTGAFTFSYEKVSDLQSQAFAPGTALLLTQKNTIMHFGLYIGEDLVLSKLGKNEIVITTLAELHRLYETDTVYQLEPAEKTDQDVTYNPKPLQSAFLFLGGALPNPLPTHVKLKNPEHLPLFSSPVRLRFDCQGRSIDPHLLLPYRDRIDYIEDCPHPISLPAASDRLGHKSICIHKPTVKGIPPYSNSRTILSSSFESDLGLCQIAALAHALDLAHEVHGIGTLHLTQNLLLREKATFHAGYFTPPSRLEPQNLHYIHTIL